jgi:hypothetical protein
MSSEHDPGEQTRPGTNRRSFLRTSGGVATGIAVTVLPTGVVALAAPSAASAHDDPAAERVEASGDVPTDTVMAYVHDAKNGIVTVVSGTGEKTYRDPALAKRLHDAAHTQIG